MRGKVLLKGTDGVKSWTPKQLMLLSWSIELINVSVLIELMQINSNFVGWILQKSISSLFYLMTSFHIFSFLQTWDQTSSFDLMFAFL